MNQTEQLALNLLNGLHTTESVKRVSMILENLSGNLNFKKMAFEIVSDENLSIGQKTRQMMNLLNRIDVQELVIFLTEMFNRGEFWLFDSQSFDHFDEFSKAFQTSVDQATIVHMATSVELSVPELEKIGLFFSEMLKKHALLNHHINAEIGAGVQVRIDNLIFDYSLNARLKRFEKKWIDSLVSTSKLISVE